MKAWLANEDYEGCSIVVFAETRGKARSLAFYNECFDGYKFCDIEVRRAPHMDKYYKEGKTEMDWENPKDRIALVKECGFRCVYVEPYLCDECPAKEYCDTYGDYEEECEDIEEGE